MMRRILFVCLIICVLPVRVRGEPIRWVDFDIPYESLRYAMDLDIKTGEQEKHIDWIDVLALAACRTGGKCGIQSVKTAADQLRGNKSPEELLGSLYRHYDYYHSAYTAVLGGFLGNYAVYDGEKWNPVYGLKAFSPIAAGYGYSHCSDFGAGRSYGFARKHLGNDLMGRLGTPIVAVEGGVIEAMGWNQYGGWRIGIRSFDSKRYYYYAHLQKDTPFAKGLQPGDTVQAGQLIGFMGRTGYSLKENVNNIDSVHLHFGMQLIFDESQKECNSEIWIDVYDIVKLLASHRSAYQEDGGLWQRAVPFEDLDFQNLPIK